VLEGGVDAVAAYAVSVVRGDGAFGWIDVEDEKRAGGNVARYFLIEVAAVVGWGPDFDGDVGCDRRLFAFLFRERAEPFGRDVGDVGNERRLTTVEPPTETTTGD
jgi:hypothetical protein